MLHSVYHWPNGWDHVPPGAAMPRGESSQWGDYHARELALTSSGCAEAGRTSRSSAAARPGSRMHGR